jgi:hypothetical protein
VKKEAREEAKKTSQVPHTNVNFFHQLKDFFLLLGSEKVLASGRTKEKSPQLTLICAAATDVSM